MNIEISNGAVSAKSIEVSFPLPRALQTDVHLQLTNNRTSLLLFLTSTTPDSAGTPSLGSFVYAMPNKSNPSDTLCTPLYTHSGNLDFTTRLAKILARKIGKPVYVGNSISFATAGLGGAVEEEMEGFRRCVQVVTGLIDQRTEEK